MPYVAGDDHKSQLIFARLYSKYRVRIQDSCLAGSCSSYNNKLPHYFFWRCLMFSKSIIPWTYAPVETLYGQISAGGASFPKQGQAWKRHRVGLLLLPVTSGLVPVPCGCLASQAQVSAAIVTIFPCFMNCHNGNLLLKWSWFNSRQVAALKMKAPFSPLLSKSCYFVLARAFRKCWILIWR